MPWKRIPHCWFFWAETNDHWRIPRQGPVMLRSFDVFFVINPDQVWMNSRVIWDAWALMWYYCNVLNEITKSLWLDLSCPRSIVAIIMASKTFLDWKRLDFENNSILYFHIGDSFKWSSLLEEWPNTGHYQTKQDPFHKHTSQQSQIWFAL